MIMEVEISILDKIGIFRLHGHDISVLAVTYKISHKVGMLFHQLVGVLDVVIVIGSCENIIGSEDGKLIFPVKN